MQTEVAVELGIMPTMPRRWQRKLQESGTPPADQASETARLRRGLDRTRMERDILKKPLASSRRWSRPALRRCRGEVRFHRAACVHLAGERHVPPGI